MISQKGKVQLSFNYKYYHTVIMLFPGSQKIQMYQKFHLRPFYRDNLVFTFPLKLSLIRAIIKTVPLVFVLGKGESVRQNSFCCNQSSLKDILNHLGFFLQANINLELVRSTFLWVLEDIFQINFTILMKISSWYCIKLVSSIISHVRFLEQVIFVVLRIIQG